MRIALLCSLILFATVPATHQYMVEQHGQRFDPEGSYSVYLRAEDGQLVSPWHDIPLYADTANQTVNMVVEIPRFSQAKFEINREWSLNPIRQDTEGEGGLRFLPNVFPWHGHVCNYGAVPQTWENPFHKDAWTGLRGDRDPLDVCEVGSVALPTGTVLPVRVLGILAMLDSDETDWKVIAMAESEAEELGVRDLAGLEAARPGLQAAVKDFFRVYKVPSDKGENEFAYDGEIQGTGLAREVISFLHEEWFEMMRNCSAWQEAGQYGVFNTDNTKVDWSQCRLSTGQAENIVRQQPEFIPEDGPVLPAAWSFLESEGSSAAPLATLTVLAALLCSLAPSI